MTVPDPAPRRGPAAAVVVPRRGDASTCPTGSHVLLYRRPGQYVVSAGLALDLPLTAEPRDLEGVAGAHGRHARPGHPPPPRTAFADAVEYCGAVLQAAVTYSSHAGLPRRPGRRTSPRPSAAGRGAWLGPELADDDVERERALQLGADRAAAGQRLRPRRSRAAGRPSRRPLPRGADAVGEPDDPGVGDRRRRPGLPRGRTTDPGGATLVLAGDLPATRASSRGRLR